MKPKRLWGGLVELNVEEGTLHMRQKIPMKLTPEMAEELAFNLRMLAWRAREERAVKALNFEPC